MSKPIRVRIMGRTYPLRVDSSDEAYMRDVASFVDEKMQTVRENFPGQPELTSAVIAALSLAEELLDERAKRERQETRVHGELQEMIEDIDGLVGDGDRRETDESDDRESNGT